MCARCASKLRKAYRVEWLVRALSVMPVTFTALFDLRLVDKSWNHAVNTLLSLYRGLQYKLPCHKYTKIESDFLWSHYSEFGGHISWQIHAVVSFHDKGLLAARLEKMALAQTKTTSCRWLLCTRTCCDRMSIDNIIHLGMSGSIQFDMFAQWFLHTLDTVRPDVHQKMMFWWVHIGLRHPKLFENGLLPICLRHLDLMYALWFECELQKNESNKRFVRRVQVTIQEAVSPSVREQLAASIAFVNLLSRLVRLPNNNTHKSAIQQFFSTYPSACLPWNPSMCVVGILNTKRLSSKTRPLKVTCRIDSGQTVDILVKQEDVRTDRLAMAIGYWIMALTEQVHIHLYDVFPFSQNMGCVTMIPNATTLYDVRTQCSLLNFLLTNNPTETVATVRERIVASCAGACLLAFTIGLGDRHLENIMVTRDGYLVHVDFGYVLGDDPKHVSTPMRITEDMVDAIGGKTSANFVSFVQRTQRGYEAMRLHASFWYHLLVAESYIFGNPTRDWKRIRNHVLDRFVPGEWNDEASLHIQTVVQQAANDSFLQKFSDFAHSASNRIEDMFRMEL